MSFIPQPPPNPIFILQNSKPINIVVFSNYNNNLLYTGNRNGDLNIFNINFRRSIFSANPNSEAVLSIVEIDKENFLSHSRNGQILKWTKLDEKTWKFNCIYFKEAFTFCQSKINFDRKVLYVPSKESGVIEAVDLNECKKLYEIKSDNQTKTNRGMIMCIKPIETEIICGYENGELALFNTANQIENASVNLFKGQPILSFDFCVSKNLGIASSSDTEIKQFSIKKSEQECSIELTMTVKITNPGINCIKIRPSDSLIFSCGCWDSRIRIFSLKKVRLLAVLDFHNDAINTIDFSNDNLMVSGSNDNIISIWDIYK